MLDRDKIVDRDKAGLFRVKGLRAAILRSMLPGRRDPVPATMGELTSLCLLGPPCCAHIALCDGACRDSCVGLPGAGPADFGHAGLHDPERCQ